MNIYNWRSILNARIYSIFLALLLFPTLLNAQNWRIEENWVMDPSGSWGASVSWLDIMPDGNILVVVRTAPYFRIFDREGNFIRAWGEEGVYKTPHSLTYDKDGNYWVTDTGRHVADKYTPDGQLILTLGMLDESGNDSDHYLFNQANDIFVTAEGDVYVTDGYNNSRVIQYDSNGEFVRIIGGVHGSGDGELDTPHGVVLDSKGRIIVNDSGNKRVSVFSHEGEFIEHWPFPSRGGLVILPDDTIYVSDTNAGEINIVNDGNLLDTIKVNARPHGLVVANDGTVYISDSMNRQVMRASRR